MAITFPAPVSYIADLLRVPQRTFALQEQQELSMLGAGEVYAANLGPALWVADIQTKAMRRPEANILQSRLETLDGSINAFYLYDPWKCVPALDPGGTRLDGYTPQIASLNANNKALTISGLPANYTLTAGDMLAFDYGSSPTRRALHRVVETVTSNGSGTTPMFEVRPHIRPGATVGATVILKKPAALMRLVPGSISITAQGGMTSFQFQATQTLR